jgi:hypothetical protein
MLSAAIVARRPSLAGFSVYGANSFDGLDPDRLRRFVLRESPCLLGLAFDPNRTEPRKGRASRVVTYCRGCYQPSASWREAITLRQESLQAVDRMRSARNRGYQVMSLQSP